MGYIKDGKKFVVINISLEDIFKADPNAIRFTLASLGVYFLRRAAPELAATLEGNINTLTDYFFKDGDLVVCVGKSGYERKEVEADIQRYKELNQ